MHKYPKVIIAESGNYVVCDEASRPSYQMRDIGSGGGVFSSILDTVFQQRNATSAAAGSRNGKGQKVGVSTNIK